MGAFKNSVARLGSVSVSMHEMRSSAALSVAAIVIIDMSTPSITIRKQHSVCTACITRLMLKYEILTEYFWELRFRMFEHTSYLESHFDYCR